VEAGEPSQSAITGCIGVGTWNTQAEFKNVKVTATDGNVLFASDFSNTNGWKFLGDGSWALKDGALEQTAEKEFVRAIAGDKSWRDYNLELRARKLGGREGFIILFGIKDDEDRNWWNIGGWNNTAHAVEFGQTLDRKGAKVESNRWYDIKIQIRGATVKCWLNGRLVHEIKDTLQPTQRLYASSTLDKKTGDIIVKLVNTASDSTDIELALDGATNPGPDAKATVLTSASPEDENSLGEPAKVSPESATIRFSGNVIKHPLPGNSFTVLRIPAGKTAHVPHSHEN
jgi:alpha-L-arabinofuranosidase